MVEVYLQHCFFLLRSTCRLRKLPGSLDPNWQVEIDSIRAFMVQATETKAQLCNNLGFKVRSLLWLVCDGQPLQRNRWRMMGGISYPTKYEPSMQSQSKADHALKSHSVIQSNPFVGPECQNEEIYGFVLEGCLSCGERSAPNNQKPQDLRFYHVSATLSKALGCTKNT